MSADPRVEAIMQSLGDERRLAVVVRCGARGGRCGGLLGVVTVPRLTTRGGQRFVLVNDDRPRMEWAIPMDFSGGVDFMVCPNTDRRSSYRKDEEGRLHWTGMNHWSRRIGTTWRNGEGAGPWPFSGLREPVERFRHTGETQEYRWAPW